MRREKGITLVSLVVTIIILIILAGVSINLTLGDNGIITISKRAKENIELAKIEEEKELNELYTQLESDGVNSGGTTYDSIAKLTEFKRKIAEAITNQKVETLPDATADTMSENIGKILQARTADATATADNISEGKTAYVNGELITGNGKDNDTSYENGKNDSSGTKGITDLGTGTSFDVSSYEGYQNFTAEDFLIVPVGVVGTNKQGTYCGETLNNSAYVYCDFIGSTFPIKKTYNSGTGKLTISGNTIQAKGYVNGYSYNKVTTTTLTCKAYLIR